MERKTVSGPLRDKERTKKKLINTVGKILKTEGFYKLKITNIAKKAGVDRKLIYEYFGSTENLINSYLHTKDFGSQIKQSDFITSENSDHGKEYSKILLMKMFAEIETNKELQRIIVWELSEKNNLLRQLAEERESLGDKIFDLLMFPFFKENHKSYRAVMAIIISSIYYLNLHRESNGSKFCGLDIKNDQDKQALLSVMKDFIDFAYQKYQFGKLK